MVFGIPRRSGEVVEVRLWALGGGRTRLISTPLAQRSRRSLRSQDGLLQVDRDPQGRRDWPRPAFPQSPEQRPPPAPFGQTSNPPHPGRSHVLKMLSETTTLDYSTASTRLDDPEPCLLLELAGPSLSTLLKSQAPGGLSIASGKIVTRQILLALDFLHRECGIYHLCELSFESKPSSS